MKSRKIYLYAFIVMLAACAVPGGEEIQVIPTIQALTLTSKPIDTLTHTATHTVPVAVLPTITPIAAAPSTTPWPMDYSGPIAYIYGSGDQNISLMNADGTQLRVLFTNLFGSNEIDLTAGLSWSPDGQYIAYATSTWADIYILSITDGTVRNLSNSGDKIDTDPAWSPDGSKIAFTSNLSGNKFDIFIMDLDGSNLVQLTDCPGRCEQPDWSPGGETIAYVSDYNLYLMNADGSGQRKLTTSGINLYPTWSPDGQRIAFSRSVDFDAPSFLYLVNPDGTNMVALTGDSDNIRQLSWSPDARFIVFENFPAVGPIATLWIVEVQSGATRPITFSSGSYAPAWTPIININPEEINALPDCTSGWTRLAAGGQGRVMGAPTDPSNRVRSGPSKADAVIGQISPGTILQVLEGPVCADGLVFWKVANTTIPGGSGWTAEGDSNEYYLEPYQP